MRNSSAEEHRLVKAALSKAGEMQGNRNYYVWILVRQKNAHSFQSQERQRISQMCLPIIFEGVDQVADGTFIEEVRSGSIKMWWTAQARAAVVIAPRPDKGDSADRAER